MKRFFLLLTLIVFITSISKAQQIVQQQFSFVGKSMATWCYPCGTWGWELQDSIVQDNAGKAIVVELYASSSDAFLLTPTAVSLVDNFGASNSIPAWYVNGINKTAYATNGEDIYPALTQIDVNENVDSAYHSDALANANFTYTITGDSLKVNAQTEFFNNTSGNYNLAIYIIEDNVAAPQNGRGNPGYPTTKVLHSHVLRASASSSDFGNPIASGTISAGSIYNSSFSTPLNSAWNPSNIWLAAVIWKKAGSAINGYRYEYVNGYSNVETMTEGIKPFSASNLRVKLMANPVSTTSQFSVTTDKTVNSISIGLFDILGRPVLTVYKGMLTEGSHTFTLNPGNLESGLYLMQITNGKEQYVSKLVIQK